jgi:iron complex outermembrane receptor protein
MSRNDTVRGTTLLASSVAMALAATTSIANEQALEEVVVTAQKRADSLQKVPIAISAYTDEDLARMAGNVMEQVARNTPNVYYLQADTMKSSTTRIRGISTVAGTAGTDPSVGYYLDDVYLGAAVGNNIDFYDVERIEVLRGPQGTLFGRNTTGGVISVTTRRPTQESEGYVEAQLGNYSLKRYKASVSGPIVDDKLAASISGMYVDREGYLFNDNLKSDTNGIHQYGGRVSLLFTPSDRSEFLFNFDMRKVNQTAQSQETYANNPKATLSFTHRNFNPTDRKVFGGFLGKETFDGWGGALNARIKFDSVDLVSVSGYRSHDYYVEGESDQVPFGVGRNFDPESVDMFTQEFRLESTGEGKLRWIGGLYYYNHDALNDGGISIERDLLVLFGGQGLGALAPLLGGSRGTTKTESWAAFGSLDYAVSDQWTLSLGGRYTNDKKEFTWVQKDLEAIFGDPILGGTGRAAGNDSWSKFTPAFTARYQYSPATMFYGTASQGYKGGGFNDGSGVPSQQSKPYDPETIWNYEIGVKSTFMNGRVRLNAAAFMMDWKDIQVRADDPATPNSFDPRLTNAAKAHSNGLEVEFTALVTDALKLELNGALLDTGYDEGVIPTGIGRGIPLKEFTRTPKYSYSVNAEYATTAGESMDLTFRVEFQGQAKTYVNVDSRDPFRSEPGYNLVNARVTLAGKNGGWRTSLWGMNLTDEVYRISAFDLYNNGLVGQYFSILGAPKTYGIDLRYDF